MLTLNPHMRADVPISGQDSIDRRIKHCKTLKFNLNDKKCGVKKIHQITDVGKPGDGASGVGLVAWCNL